MEHEKTLSQRYIVVWAAATGSSANTEEPFLVLFLCCPRRVQTMQIKIYYYEIYFMRKYTYSKSQGREREGIFAVMDYTKTRKMNNRMNKDLVILIAQK